MDEEFASDGNIYSASPTSPRGNAEEDGSPLQRTIPYDPGSRRKTLEVKQWFEPGDMCNKLGTVKHNYRNMRCKFCKKIVQGQRTTLENHLVDAKKCEKTPVDVREAVKVLKQKRSLQSRRRVDESAYVQVQEDVVHRQYQILEGQSQEVRESWQSLTQSFLNSSENVRALKSSQTASEALLSDDQRRIANPERLYKENTKMRSIIRKRDSTILRLRADVERLQAIIDLQSTVESFLGEWRQF